MDNKDMLGNATRTLAGLVVENRKHDVGIAALDRGILEVALMIAGLDGSILESEYTAFAAMMGKCRGATAASRKALCDSAIAKAGRVVAMARSGLYTEASRLKTFVCLSHDALPRGFADGSLADLRRAFALWIAMGVSDGAFSGFERRCVKVLVRRFALARAGKVKRFAPILEPEFFPKAERIFRDMTQPSRRAKAEQALADLITSVPVKTEAGLARHPSAAIKLAVSLPGPTISGWR